MSSPNADKPSASPETTGPLIERLYRYSPLSPAWTGLCFALLSISLFIFIEALAGRTDGILRSGGYEREAFVFVVLHLVMLAYVPTALVVLTREARRNAQALSRFVEPSKEMRALLARVGSYPTKWYIAAGIVGLIVGTIAPLLDTEVWLNPSEDPLNFSRYTGEVWAQRVIAWIFGFYVGALVFAASVEAARFNRFARHVTQEHVLDKKVLVPFTRQGLLNVLLVAGFPAILSLFLFNIGLLYMVMGIAAIALAVAFGGLLAPLMGIHNRVHDAKAEQLEWVDKELTVERNALKGGAGERFVSLMAYRSYIESVKEWPLDGSTLGRLAFYLAIPLVSWVGAAIVERFVNAALG